MPVLDDYRQFDGLHWETGSLRNYFDYRGVAAPHTGQPYSEALLMGISGGAVMGYFSFAYEGYDPQARILTRNTFDPLDTLLARLGVAQNMLHTSSADKGRANLIQTLEEGLPAIVWADLWSLPYNALDYDEGMWGMMPIVVYGYDEGEGRVWIADRARVPLTVTVEELAAARARVKKDKFRLLTLDPPNPDKLASAVQMGIWDCIKLFTEAPPKGSASNFGFKAYQRWADLLVKPTMRLSWEKAFPAGVKLYAGLTSAFTDIALFGKGGVADADRTLYAAFLEEASVLLDRPSLLDVAGQFRVRAAAWREVGEALLPDDVPLLKETRELMLQRHTAFLARGGEVLEEIMEIDARLAAIKDAVAGDFPLGGDGVQALQATLRERVLAVGDIEQDAVGALQAAMG